MKSSAKPATKPAPERSAAPSERDRRLFVVSAIIFVVTVLAAVFALGRGGSPSQSETINMPAQNSQISTTPILSPAQVTEAYALAAQLSGQRGELQQMVDACADYRPERRTQMNFHLSWLADPDTIPSEILIALGSNPVGKLIFGMATYTSSEWKLQGSLADSCLLPIGRKLNDMLIAAGEAPFEEFNTPS